MSTRTFRRPLFDSVLRRVREPRRFIQVLAGPRQAGKTTLARQLLEVAAVPSHYASADEPTLQGRPWIEAQWDLGRIRGLEAGRGWALLVLDEVQKVTGWSDTVKRLWDEDTASRMRLKLLLLGSAPLLVHRGLAESLAGRFELIHVPHWSFAEMRDAFGYKVEEFVYFGGYPGASSLIRDQSRWARYIVDSLVETTVSRDILLLTRVDKPALLRRLFQLACDYSGQVLSYQKMMGQLQDAGNTTTLAHYLDLLSGAGVVTGLQKYSGARVRQRGSSPKLQVLNTGLITAPSGVTFRAARIDPDFWGRLVESAVGAHLINTSAGTSLEVDYWRERNMEVDFVLRAGRRLTAIEVTTSRRKGTFSGMQSFATRFRPNRRLLVGGQGIPVEDFLLKPASYWVE